MRLQLRKAAWISVLAAIILVSAALSGGRNGGASRGGGGGSRGGGGGGGAPVSRPAQHSSSQPAAQRQASVHGPYAGGVPSHTQPSSRPAGGSAGERQVRQTSGGGTAAAGKNASVYTGQKGGVAIHGSKTGEVTGPGGREIAGGKSGTAVIGPNGNVHASGSKGVGVKGPDGAAIAGEHGGVTAGPGGVAAHGSRAGAAVGPGGAVAGGSRAGAAVGPGGAVAGGSRAGAAVGPGGAVAAGSRAGVASGPYGAAAVGGRGVAARGGGTYAGGTRFTAASDLRGQGASVRNSFNSYNAFTPEWNRRYSGAWVAGGLVAGSAWSAANWGGCASYIGYPADTSPIYYNYGDNVSYQDGNVYYGDQVYATQDEYAQQAIQIADSGRQAQPSQDEKWQSLGVFAMVKGDETTSNDIFQFALNKDGVVRGNYYNTASDSTQPVYGSLDKKGQRIAWTIGDKKDPVYETGLYNLTQDETTMLVHSGKDRTEQYKLFRVEQQDEKKEPAK